MAHIKVKYFGKLRELLSLKSEDYEVEDGATLAALLMKCIPERHKKVSQNWNEEIFRKVNGKIAINKDATPVLRNYLILVEGKTSNLGHILKEGDEVAVLPPAGGG